MIKRQVVHEDILQLFPPHCLSTEMRMLGLITKKVIFLPIGHRYEVNVIYKRFEVKNQIES